MLIIALEYLILASTFTLAKEVLSYAPYLFLLTVRFSIGGLLLLAGAAFLKKLSLPALWKDKWLFLAVALLHIYFAFVLEFWALQYTTSAKAALYYALTPFFSAAFSYFFYAERLKSRQWAGMTLAVAGIIPLMIDVSSVQLALPALPDLVLLGAVLSATLAWFVVKHLMNRGHHLVVINGVAMLIGSLLCGITMLCVNPYSWVQVSDWPGFLGWLSLLIFLSQVVSYNLYSWLLTQYSITFMTLCGALCPFFSAILGAVFLQENISLSYMMSLVAVIGGLLLFTGGVYQKSSSD